MHKELTNIALDGFAVSSAAPGEPVDVQVKGWATSDSSLFYVYAEQIANIVFAALGASNLRNVVNRYLVVIHPDNTGDLFIDTFNVIASARATRSIQAGEVIYAKDIDDIAEVRFPGVTINSDDRVVYLTRSGWRFGIFFDFTRDVSLDRLAANIAEVHKALVLENILAKALADIQTKTTEADGQSEAYVITEGKKDWRHLECAFKANGYDRPLEFAKSEEDLGDQGLLEICRRVIHFPPQKVPIICVFDRDNPKIIAALNKKSLSTESDYQYWGNNVFSIVLPRPQCREEYENISIEMYYSNDTLRLTTADGKRLYFNNELEMRKPVSGGTPEFTPIAPLKNAEHSKRVYSGLVENIKDSDGRPVGLSKTAFSELVYSGEEPFTNIDFGNFRLISDVIDQIVQDVTD